MFSMKINFVINSGIFISLLIYKLKSQKANFIFYPNVVQSQYIKEFISVHIIKNRNCVHYILKKNIFLLEM